MALPLGRSLCQQGLAHLPSSKTPRDPWIHVITAPALVCLIAVFAFTALISVVTGGTSLITVPVMMQLGIDPHVAVATNMLTLIFLSVGGTVPLLRGRLIPRKRLPALVGSTLVGSILGALLLLVIPSKAIPLVVAVAMIMVAVFSLTKSTAGLRPAVDGPSPASEVAGYTLAFLLGIYGGFFSGGYVALLTAAFVCFFKMTFIEAVAVTKVLNVCSSSVATAVFAVQGLIDWRLGLILGLASFIGATVGAMLARQMSNALLRRIFLVAVIALAVKTLVSDLPW
jgi:uncharacterized protein